MTALPTTPAPATSDIESDALRRYAEASGFRLAWWKFRRHRLAVWAAGVVVLLYVLAVFAEFFSPYDPGQINRRHALVPPQTIHVFDADGRLAWPHVRALVGERDPVTRRLTYLEDPSTTYPVRFLAEAKPYELLGLIPLDRKFIGIDELAGGDRNATFFLLGTDSLGRDLLSRIIHGARVSLSIGLVGVAASFVIGIILGGLSGYYGGWVDNLIQRTIDFLQSLPTIPLWMGLAVAVPPGTDPIITYLMITLILSIIGWTGIARVVRGRFLALREEDFVMAARFSGASEMRIILRHMTPSFMSHIIAALTLAIPEMILAETALSFLGLGMQAPAVSWGVLMKDAQSLLMISQAPWLLLPGVMVIITVLAFNFFGDGLRDAADPYGKA